MINKESILSAFTDRATLLLWLKKVEAALKNAVLSDVSVNSIFVQWVYAPNYSVCSIT